MGLKHMKNVRQTFEKLKIKKIGDFNLKVIDRKQ